MAEKFFCYRTNENKVQTIFQKHSFVLVNMSSYGHSEILQTTPLM